MCLACFVPNYSLSEPKKKCPNNTSCLLSHTDAACVATGGFPTCAVGVPNHRDATILGTRGWNGP